MWLLDRLLGYRFEVWTRTTLGSEGSYVTRQRGRDVSDAWAKLLHRLDQPDPHEVISMRLTRPVDWPRAGAST